MACVQAFLAVFFSLFTLVSCAKSNPDEALVKTTVARYNDALVAAYKNLNIEPMKDVATEERAKRVEAFITAYLQSNLIMETELHHVTFDEVKVERTVATVKTTEDWSYSWVDYKTKKIKEEKKQVTYKMLYTLEKKGDKWIVTDARDLAAPPGPEEQPNSEKQPASKSYHKI